ncbi:MAG: L-threonylcarbamoyladenylate synthase [Cyanobacteria bacterium KgW148]|nr:L-threonylcarbamoyladenylate synthase [Cyanobacteria bacterium KgW148]
MPLVSTAVVVAGARSGTVVAFPTDTVPALAVLPGLGTKIYHLKQRSIHKPLVLMAASWSQLQDFIQGRHPQWEQVVSDYLPGALTIVLPAREQDTIGMRIPQSTIALGILQQTGPLLTTSANISGKTPLLTMTAIAAQFPSVLALGDQDPDRLWGSGQPSTVIKWEQDRWQVLRQGEVKYP